MLSDYTHTHTHSHKTQTLIQARDDQLTKSLKMQTNNRPEATASNNSSESEEKNREGQAMCTKTTKSEYFSALMISV
jgi:hypothetical protein